MKLLLPSIGAALLVYASSLIPAIAENITTSEKDTACELPGVADLIELAFPTYEVDENGKKKEGSEGRWAPLYYTKRWNGLDHPLAYPSPIDTHYPFEYAAPFHGQPGAGSAHHCPLDSPADQKVQECPKVKTSSDTDPTFGPGHINPHIALRALKDSYLDSGCPTNMTEWFDYEAHECRVKPDTLLKLIRNYYPRDDDGNVNYPPPIAGPELFPLEFPSPEGPPHWCTAEFTATGQWADWCPYVYEGADAGKYRHPHLGLAALEQFLANKIMPDKCGKEWNSEYPLSPDSSWDWVDMESEDPKAQPIIPYNWPENSANSTIKDVKSISMAPELFVIGKSSKGEVTEPTGDLSGADEETESPKADDSSTLPNKNVFFSASIVLASTLFCYIS